MLKTQFLKLSSNIRGESEPFLTCRLCRNAKTSRFVIPTEVRDLVFSATYEDEIPRLRLGMTVATQSADGELGSLCGLLM